ncbi:hypothetical protein [Amycolatopsis nigrescens]|uniref:hypothetical protein n=1 Tax=Amycolatopsis nigrescens TaxID=381445 RepID=UPI00037CB168|nr:hypothetical protein [Amycolatopsis nigrescens]
MTDLETLRAALRTPPAEDLGTVDVRRVMATGRRIRFRRRLLAGGGVAGLTAVVLFAVFSLGQLAQVTPAPPDPQITAAQPPPRPALAPLGAVVPTGIKTSGGELVFYVTAVRAAELPDVHFGLVSGYRDATGRIEPGILNNETAGSDRSPGFHHLWGGNYDSGGYLPVHGYYAGPAASITAQVGGKVVQAKQARWSEDPSIVIFWFDQPDQPRAELFSDPAAYDTAGNRLPR